MNEKAETEIRWNGLTDKNSDKLYAPKQLFLGVTMKKETGKYLRGCLKIQEITGWSKRRN